MGTRALQIVRFRKRYYIRWHQFDGYFEGLGVNIVASIPADPEEYQKWLSSMRAEYAATERELEQHVDEIGDGDAYESDSQQFGEFETLPSELPRLDRFGVEYVYIINLDREVLTMNDSIHWKLGNIPRQDDLWIRAITDSIYPYKPTISPDVCPEEHMASPALELPEENPEIDYDFRTVTPRTDIGEARNVLLTHVLAETLVEYMNDIIRFGREWTPDSFPFRELAFALVSIASGQAKFLFSPAHPRRLQEGAEAGDSAPLLKFGSMFHRPGEPPGASPTDTMYWLEDVLVSPTLVVDGKAVTKAVTWGVEQGHTNFQIVVLSLFTVIFAEVSFDDGKPFVKVSDPVDLSPLCAEYCVSTHPRERPELKPGMEIQHQRGELIMRSNCTGTARRLRNQFPGLAALVNFFDVAASRRAASKGGILPLELYYQIVDFVDCDTWKACSMVSRELRSYCLLKYRLDDRMTIVAGPFVRLREGYRGKEHMLSFDFEDMKTGKVFPMIQSRGGHWREAWRWIPVIGSDRRVLMDSVVLQFVPAADVPVEEDSDDE